MSVRRAFTLIEVLVALVIGAFALAICGRLLASVDQAAQLRESQSEAIRERWQFYSDLRTAFRNIDLAGKAGSDFLGTSNSLHFATRCQTSSDYLRPCHATLTVRADSGGCLQEFGGTGADVVHRMTGVQRCYLRYVLDGANGGQLLNEWPSAERLPMAVVLIADTASVHFLVGDVAR